MLNLPLVVGCSTAYEGWFKSKLKQSHKLVAKLILYYYVLIWLLSSFFSDQSDSNVEGRENHQDSQLMTPLINATCVVYRMYAVSSQQRQR